MREGDHKIAAVDLEALRRYCESHKGQDYTVELSVEDMLEMLDRLEGAEAAAADWSGPRKKGAGADA